MKIAITAASGQLGTAIVNELKKVIGDTQVIGIVRTPEKAKHLGVELRKGDYNSREDFNEALKGVTKVLLVSGMDAPDKRIQQHRNVIEAAKQNGVQKIVYTSIIGEDTGTTFSPVVKSNRQTEADVKNSGLDWAIGRNGIYIEPDLDYIDTYIKEGGIKNSAGDGKCTYTSRKELGAAYTQLLLKDTLKSQTFNLVGTPITQSELAESINTVFGTNLSYTAMTVEAYENERKTALGDFLGTVISGIYSGIRNGVNDVSSDFENVTGRPHKSPVEMMRAFKENI